MTSGSPWAESHRVCGCFMTSVALRGTWPGPAGVTLRTVLPCPGVSRHSHVASHSLCHTLGSRGMGGQAGPCGDSCGFYTCWLPHQARRLGWPELLPEAAPGGLLLQGQVQWQHRSLTSPMVPLLLFRMAGSGHTGGTGTWGSLWAMGRDLQLGSKPPHL